jgi:hypothetical protein
VSQIITERRGVEMPTSGEKPGIGTYTCTNCGTTVTLDDADDK